MERSSFLQNIPINHQELGNLFSAARLFTRNFWLAAAVLWFLMHLLLLLLIFIHICLPFSMTTPNGRFMTQKKICLSMSDCKFFQGSSWRKSFLVFDNWFYVWLEFFFLQFILKVGILCGLSQGRRDSSSESLFSCMCFILLIILLFACWQDVLKRNSCNRLWYFFSLSLTFFFLTNAAYSQGFFHSWWVIVTLSYSSFICFGCLLIVENIFLTYKCSSWTSS